MYTNEYLGTNTNQDVLKDTAYMFPETNLVNEFFEGLILFKMLLQLQMLHNLKL